MNIAQGDVFWISPDETEISSDHAHPHVIVQVNAQTVVVCALTSNLKRAKEPGNVLLAEGEANLSRQSVVVTSHTSTVETAKLGECIGTLAKPSIDQVLTGMRFLQTLTQHHE
ncbi:MAG: type II toxin-antitoxin system PemK/MazF family toxin [Chloroflexi bacterium]|nr:type II toxin-antitoxin system PemK/MazF family toxin [Chloroflexota bacterium]